MMNLICRHKAFFFKDSPVVTYGIVFCILTMVTWLRKINILYFAGFSYVTPEQVLFQQVLHFRKMQGSHPRIAFFYMAPLWHDLLF